MAKKTAKKQAKGARRLRSQLWFDNPDNPGMTALYLERYLNYGLTKQELTSGKPIVHGDHVHPAGPDPHVWLGVDQAVDMVERIRDELVKVDGGHADEYKKSAAAD